ncbi:MAG: exodeoxyribonuclease VII large subunit [Ruminococcaceae bacterium]|nr:exodeoxyribonuclease VII large subunit [Oscillospiraceae bacterium]
MGILDQINSTPEAVSAALEAARSVTEKKERAVLTVAQLNAYIKQLIESDKLLTSVWIKGEISNFTNHYKTGHFYFTLKDPDSLIRAVMFKSAASKLKFLPENGMKVIVHGRISAFPRDGQYQLYADAMEPDGVGSLYIAFEQLKRKLEAEGLFAPERKRPLPKIPTRVGIITSPTGAAVRDMINVAGRRFPYAKLTLFPSLVQGTDAPAQLMAGVKFFNKYKSVDVIIIGRGGGSIEDLWAFNDENLARTVAASEIPVISAVGHETDFTICDFAADMRAPTPSAAAEIAVPDTAELQRKIRNITSHMELALTKSIAARRGALMQLAGSRALTSPQNFIDDRRMTLLSLAGRMEQEMKLTLTDKRGKFASLAASLEALSPLSVIARGYSAVFDDAGNVVKSVEQLSPGDRFTFRTVDGSVVGETVEIIKENSNGK